MDHFGRLLKEDCPNHVDPIKHEFRDYSLMKSFMTSRSILRGMEVDEDLDEGDSTPFPRENTVMMIYDGRPLPERHHVPDSSLRTPARRGQGCRSVEM
jgi:hypothetical protein